MKRSLWIVAALGIALGVVAHETSRGQSKDGPGDGGAVLRLPGLDPAPFANPANPRPAVPDPLKGLWNPAAAGFNPSAPTGASRIARPPSNAADVNKDIEITPNAGPWTIVVMSYAGDKGPEMARNFVAVLRSSYKLPAYVFNYGAEEKRKEYERVEKIRQEQMDAFKRQKLEIDVPIRIPTMKIDEHTAVLIGGYKSFDEASAAVKNTIKKLNPDLLKGKVDLDMWFVSQSKSDLGAKKLSVDLDGLGYVNPFLRAFPARNPSLAKEQAISTSEADLIFLRKVNDKEPFNLLQCKKPWTLAIKQFNMQAKPMNNKKELNGFVKSFDNLWMTKPKGEWEDVAAHNAHNLAEALRKTGLPETYVLHCKHCSYVTVGAFDSLEDPQLLAMQNVVENVFKRDAYFRLDLLPRPAPMPVPGVLMR